MNPQTAPDYIDPKQIFNDHLEQARQLAANRLLRPNYFANVVGVGIGKKLVDGASTPTDCIRIYVVAKSDARDLSPAALMPGEFLDVPTDIIEIGRFGQGGHRPIPLAPDSVIGPGDPIRVSNPAPNVNSGFMGTLGAIVQDGALQKYILSCNHVLAVNGRVPRGANIVSTLTADNEKTIANRNALVRLQREASNCVDCALALLPPESTLVTEKFQERNRGRKRIIEWKSGKTIAPQKNMKVVKVGAVTGRTFGTILDVDVELYIDYSFGTFRFQKQVIIDGGQNFRFARGGDSGSIVVDTDSGQATAMIFAASGRYAVACPIQRVFDELGQEVQGDLTLVPWS
jgi:hypothetical protein